MPLGRYFLVVGGVLLALLLVAGWYLPSSPPMQSYGAPIDGSLLHIRSEHKWPERLEFGTATPAILPPSPPAVADTAVSEDPKLEALAEVRPPEKQQVVVKPKPRVATRRRNRKPSEALHFAVNPTPPMWTQSW